MPGTQTQPAMVKVEWLKPVMDSESMVPTFRIFMLTNLYPPTKKWLGTIFLLVHGLLTTEASWCGGCPLGLILALQSMAILSGGEEDVAVQLQ